VQGPRKASDVAGALGHSRTLRVGVSARLRRVAHDQLLRIGLVLQALAKRFEPVEAPKAAEMPVPTASV
jgi:hypothetical protein